ncbi:MAG: SAM-dependent methyltransferase, partial [Actinomycetota bacterium]
MSFTPIDGELKARHRAMWASGDYASMVETWITPLGPVLVEACGIGPGMRVLDVG